MIDKTNQMKKNQNEIKTTNLDLEMGEVEGQVMLKNVFYFLPLTLGHAQQLVVLHRNMYS